MLAMQREHMIGFQACRDKALGFNVNGRTTPAPDLPQDLARTDGEWSTGPSLNGDPRRMVFTHVPCGDSMATLGEPTSHALRRRHMAEQHAS
jgi:hypothetical protein